MNKPLSFIVFVFIAVHAVSCSDKDENGTVAEYFGNWEYTTAGIVEYIKFTETAFQLEKYIMPDMALHEGSKGSYILNEEGDYYEGTFNTHEKYNAELETWEPADETLQTRIEIVEENKLYLYFYNEDDEQWEKYLPDNMINGLAPYNSDNLHLDFNNKHLSS
ncbi:MAG TPA: hypothetical protein ENN63_01100 [Bacteroidetes bacterium]|nr:hypothetical protein [Bacteroidota bacterium]